MSLTYLLSVENAVGRSAVIEQNLQLLDASFSFRRQPTVVGGVPTTNIGPPTTGTFPLHYLWSDGKCGIWRCVIAGSPGTWTQLEAACGTAFPVGSIATNYRFVRTDQNFKEYYYDGATWQAVFSTPADTALMIPLTQKGAASGVATLDGGGKIPSSQLPAIAITDTSVVASQAAMLALTAETGDVAIRTDLNKCFILQGTDPTNLAHWKELLTPTDVVLSVNGFTGAVVLTTSNIAEGSNLYYTDGRADTRADSRIGAAKNIANGIAGLDAGSRIAKAQGHSATVYNDQANTYTAGFKQSFTTDATNAGVRHVGVTASPSSLAAGDVWFRTDSKVFSFYDGSATQILESQTNKAAANGYASLNGSSKVVQDPANATATATASKIPIADGSAHLDAWISDAAGGAKGLIQLGTDLGNTAAAPNVVGLKGNALPANAADGFIKRNSGNSAWEEVAYGTAANTVCQGNDARLITNVEPTQRMFRSALDDMGTALLLVSGTDYFVYLGRVAQDIVPKFVEFYVSALGTGAQTAEVGFFSTPNAPSKAAQSLTKLVSTGTVDSLTVGTGVKRNTTAFATTVVKGTHLWAGIRTAMATVQPTIAGLCMDMSQGHILSLAVGGALTGAGPWAGALVAAGSYFTSAQCPDLRAVLD